VALFELLRGGKSPPNAALEAFVREVEAGGRYIIEPAQVPTGRALLELPIDDLAATIVEAWQKACQAARAEGDFGAAPRDEIVMWSLRNLVTAMMARKPTLTVDQLVAVLDDATRKVRQVSGWLAVPLFIGQAEAALAKDRSADLARACEGLRDVLYRLETADERKLAERIDIAVTGALSLTLATRGPFGRGVAADLDDAAIPPETVAACCALLRHGLSATAAKPTARWIKQAKPLLDAIGRDAAVARIAAWLDLGPCPGEPAATRATDRDTDLIKGVLFAVAALGDAALAPAVATMAAASLRKVPNLGPVAARVGNAGINVLSELPGPAAITQLGRLRLLVKYATARRLVEKALDAAAARAGVTPDEIEEMSIPTYGLDAQGVARRPLGDVTAEIAIADDEATLSFRGANGKLFKSVPASVKEAHAAALAELRRTVKEIDQVLPAQRLRLENLMVGGRQLTVDQWRTRYLEHALIGDMSRRLVWSVAAGGATKTVMWLDGQAVDAQGAAADVPADARIQLYHPLRGTPDETLAWRRMLESHDLTQPFKQAHREVYLLTDAERVTGNYSNRFAGHVLRQHQLAALCRDRGWRYALQGGFDSANNPTLRIPGTEYSVELWTEAPGGTEDMAASGIYLHVATDQVRFTGRYDTVALEHVPPLVFSEAMRDVDLFVSVASIGTDPEWVDRGERRAYDDYWREFAFGELSATATTRRAVLESLVPKLKISDRCSFDDRHLVVRGDLATYRIHLGSGNILIEPGSRYLCIVPAAAKAGSERVKLPFKGDGMLAIILSKAFMLAADRAIKDPSILRQIQA